MQPKEKSPEQKQAEVLEAVKTLAEIFSKPLSDSALALWVETLSPLHSQELLRTLKDGAKQPRMPSLGEMMQITQDSVRRNTQIAEAKLSFDDMVKSANTPEARKAGEEAIAALREKFGAPGV